MPKLKKLNLANLKPDYQTTIFNLHLKSDDPLCVYAQYCYICNFLKKKLSSDYEDRIAYIDIGNYNIGDVWRRRFVMQILTTPQVHLIVSAPCSDSIFEDLKTHIEDNKYVSFHKDFTRTHKARTKKIIKFSRLSSHKCLFESKCDSKARKHTFTEII